VPPDLKSMVWNWSPPSFIADVVFSILEWGASGQRWLGSGRQARRGVALRVHPGRHVGRHRLSGASSRAEVSLPLEER
jgi:hypothetical protein